MVKLLRKIETYISQAEKIFITLLLSFMILLSMGSIILRNIGFSIGPWVSCLLQYSVFWVAFIGASLASRENRQVNINLIVSLLAKYPKVSRILNVFTSFFVVPVTLALGVGSYSFIKFEYEWGIDNPALGLECWIFECVIVYVFFVISFKYFVRFLEALTEIPFPEDRDYWEGKDERVTDNNYSK